ncbi:hypothetical protein H5410_046769 [Solanum commersonii]|uniref:Uncharacterized protein n=1 Tax=Solanum commersonii TaxID=4109 RepID=A0A9J5XFC1_SOLCO|nr:hypothetical protein H5410_046769 [Solanum commersonii]
MAIIQLKKSKMSLKLMGSVVDRLFLLGGHQRKALRFAALMVLRPSILDVGLFWAHVFLFDFYY